VPWRDSPWRDSPWRDRERGSTVLTTMLALLAMLPIGLGLLAVIDVQSAESKNERVRDAAYNFAETVLNSEAFILGSVWPNSPASAPSNSGPTGAGGQCQTTPFGSTLAATPATDSAPARLQPILTESFASGDYSDGAWEIVACDDAAGVSTWSDAVLANWNYDQNANGRMWVRAVTKATGKRRAVVGLVERHNSPAFSTKYGVIAGRLGADIGTATSQLTGNLDVAHDLLKDSQRQLVGPDPSDTTNSGHIGLRCSALDTSFSGNLNTCLSGALAGLATTNSVIAPLISDGRLVQYAEPQVATDDQIQQFRNQAIVGGTYVTITAADAACAIPTAATAQSVVFIEQVGDGDGACILDASANPTYKMIVVGNGRIIIRGDGNTAHSNRLTGVVYALNLQRATLGDSVRDVVTIDGDAHVKGAVFIDGKESQLATYPASVTACQPKAINLFCTLQSVIDGLVTTLNDALLNYHSTGPAIQADIATIRAVTAFTWSAIVPGTFQAVTATNATI